MQFMHPHFFQYQLRHHHQTVLPYTQGIGILTKTPHPSSHWKILLIPFPLFRIYTSKMPCTYFLLFSHLKCKSIFPFLPLPPACLMSLSSQPQFLLPPLSPHIDKKDKIRTCNPRFPATFQSFDLTTLPQTPAHTPLQKPQPLNLITVSPLPKETVKHHKTLLLIYCNTHTQNTDTWAKIITDSIINATNCFSSHHSLLKHISNLSGTNTRKQRGNKKNPSKMNT